jgi:hypothetical protein
VASILLCTAACGRVGFQSNQDEDLVDAGSNDVDAEPGVSSGQWNSLGGSATAGGVSNSTAAVRTAKVASSPTGEAYMVWSDERSGNMDVYVSTYIDGAWAGLGSSMDMGGISNDPGESLAGPLVFYEGRATVMWRGTSNADGSGTRSVFLKHWDGNAWVGLDGSDVAGITIGGNAWWPSLIVDGNGDLVAAWEVFSIPGSNGGVIRGQRYSGGTWQEFGGSLDTFGISGGDGDARHPHLAAGSGGTVFLSYTDDRGGVDNIYVLEWDGTSWNELGGSGSGTGISNAAVKANRCHLDVDATGAPLVTWIDDEGGSAETVFVKRFNGASWEELAGSASGAGILGQYVPGGNPSIAVNGDGVPVVAWQQKSATSDNIFATQWTGSEWQHLVEDANGLSATTGDSAWPTIATDPMTGSVLVGWTERLQDGSSQAYMRALQ